MRSVSTTAGNVTKRHGGQGWVGIQRHLIPRYFTMYESIVIIALGAPRPSISLRKSMKALSGILQGESAASDVVWRSMSRRMICSLRIFLRVYRSRHLDRLAPLRLPCVTSASSCAGRPISLFVATHLCISAEQCRVQWRNQTQCTRDEQPPSNGSSIPGGR